MPLLLSYTLLFVLVGVLFIFVHLVAGKLIRPSKPEPEKLTVYECGEPTVGSAWVQFDLRYYVVALLFVIFEVEVAFFFPWAVVFGKLNALGDPTITAEQRQELNTALLPSPSLVGSAPAAEQSESVQTLAWIAFGDIMVFFGVLLVGFAYLWRRGDINWVRSMAAEARPQELRPGVEPPPEITRPPLVEVGQTI